MSLENGAGLGNLTAQEVLKRIEDCRALGKLVTLHPNGFLQFRLADAADKRNTPCLLHIWSDQIKRRGEERFQVHDHPFQIDSRILVGSLINQIYNVESDSNGEYRLFVGDGIGQLSRTEDRVSCALAKEEIVSAGETYHIAKGEFHSSLPRSPLVATLVLKSAIDSGKPRVLAPITYTESRIAVERTVDQVLAWSLLTTVENEIKQMDF